MQDFLHSHEEWIAVEADGGIFGLRSHEMELEEQAGVQFFGFLSATGYSVWRLEDAEVDDRGARLTMSRRYGSDRRSLELIPRTSPSDISAGVREARIAAANAIGDAIAKGFPDLSVSKVTVGNARSRFVRVKLDAGARGDYWVISDIAGGCSPESLLTRALLWQAERDKGQIRRPSRTFVVAGRGKLSAIRRLHACIDEGARRRIGILSLSGGLDGRDVKITTAPPIGFEDLWKAKAPPLRRSESSTIPSEARRILSIDPLNIDHLFARHGLTLRYRGLAFARFRRMKSDEKGWFGVQPRRQVMASENGSELDELLASLIEYRRHDSPNKQHLFYQAAPEAWLESMLRRNITRLDPGLILSPVYNQFRTSRDRIDLLALTRRGRLVIVEVKVAADSAMVFQAVDYWRKIELQRRQGILERAGVFGNTKIADSPAIVYLVAPALSFGRSTETLTNAVTREIDIVRFELNEDWRDEIKVVKVT